MRVVWDFDEIPLIYKYWNRKLLMKPVGKRKTKRKRKRKAGGRATLVGRPGTGSIRI